MSEKRWLRKLRIWRSERASLGVFRGSCWSHPSSSGWFTGICLFTLSCTALCCDWCCRLTGSPAGMSVSRAFGCLGLIGGGLEKVGKWGTDISDCHHQFCQGKNSKKKTTVKPFPVAHAVRPRIWGNSLGKGRYHFLTGLSCYMAAGLITLHSLVVFPVSPCSVPFEGFALPPDKLHLLPPCYRSCF